MTRRRLLLWVVLGLASWAIYSALQPAVDMLWPADGGRAGTDSPVHTGALDPRDWESLLDLRGTWSFRIGDDPAWANPALDLAAWDSVFVPAAWENEGYFGYDGHAWYRTTFQLDVAAIERVQAASPFLLLGRIDDADEAWLNGVYLDRGGVMPPRYTTASYSFRRYRIPPDLLRLDGENVLTVRVFDSGLEGGILEGPVALAVPTERNPESAPLVADLAGDWQFRPGDDADWAAPDLDDSDWRSLRVPAPWEPQGYADYNGIAWYRKTVTLTEAQIKSDLMLILGAVDDIDQAFVNGVQVGSTGDFETLTINDSDWQTERAYPIPRQVLQVGENVVAVCVYDGVYDGGIYRGPVGLMTTEAYATRQALRR